MMVVYVVKSLYINFGTLDQMHLNFFLVHLGSCRKNILVRNPGKPKLKKIKNPPRKNFLYFRKWNFPSAKIIYFPTYTFRPQPSKFFPKKISYIFSKKNLFLYFRKQNFLIFQKTELSSPKTKNFKRELYKLEKFRIFC